MTDKKKLKVGSVLHLENGGAGLVFKIKSMNASQEILEIPAFAVRYQDHVRVFKNICGHIAIKLDFQPGQFFDEEGEYLICSTHGAQYAPETGKCLGGPCYGVGLELIESEEINGELFIVDQTVESVI